MVGIGQMEQAGLWVQIQAIYLLLIVLTWEISQVMTVLVVWWVTLIVLF